MGIADVKVLFHGRDIKDESGQLNGSIEAIPQRSADISSVNYGAT